MAIEITIFTVNAEVLNSFWTIKEQFDVNVTQGSMDYCILIHPLNACNMTIFFTQI